MNTKIFHSANAGLYFWDGSLGLLADGIYQGYSVGFSDLPLPQEHAARSGTGCFAHLDGLLFTHLHPDHFERELAQTVWTRGDLLVCGPGLDLPAGMLRPICTGTARLRIKNSYILARNSIHDGPLFRDVPHRSYLIRTRDESFFLPGDAALEPADADFFRCYYGGGVTAAFVNLYQAVSPEGQAFLRRLEPQRIFLSHLPLPEDDQNNFWRLAEQSVKNFPRDLPPLERLEQMAWVDGEPADWAALPKSMISVHHTGGTIPDGTGTAARAGNAPQKDAGPERAAEAVRRQPTGLGGTAGAGPPEPPDPAPGAHHLPSLGG